MLFLLTLAGCTASLMPTASPPAPTATFGALPVSPQPTMSPTPAPPTVPPTPTQTPLPTATQNPYPWTDELFTMYGICFEAALDASGEVFVLRSAEEHIRFYDMADNSGLCRRPVTRNPFDFQNGERVLAGLWSVGTGCTANHTVDDYTIEGDTLRLMLTFGTEGDCNYELVRPFWIGVEGVENVEISVSNAE